nr:CoA pyrophosphatase [uncultured Cetobacterium sp.]
MDFTEKIIGKERYFNSAVLALVVNIKNEEHILFQKRASNIRQGGDISFPGGKVEKKDRSSLDTALRECYEEIGICREKIDIKGKIGTLIIPSGVLVEAYLGYTNLNSLEELIINKDEVEYCFLIPLSYFKNTTPRIERLQVETKPYVEIDGKIYKFPAEELNLPKMYHKPWKSNPREVFMYLYEDKVIWGITAEIVVELIKYI